MADDGKAAEAMAHVAVVPARMTMPLQNLLMAVLVFMKEAKTVDLETEETHVPGPELQDLDEAPPPKAATLNTSGESIDALLAENAQLQSEVHTLTAKVEEDAEQYAATLQQNGDAIKKLKYELDAAKKQTSAAVAAATKDVVAHNEELLMVQVAMTTEHEADKKKLISRIMILSGQLSSLEIRSGQCARPSGCSLHVHCLHCVS